MLIEAGCTTAGGYIGGAIGAAFGCPNAGQEFGFSPLDIL